MTEIYKAQMAAKEKLDGIHERRKEQQTSAELARELAGLEEQLGACGDTASESSGAQQEALQALQEKYTEFREQLEQDIQNKVSLFDTFDGGEDITVEKMLEGRA